MKKLAAVLATAAAVLGVVGGLTAASAAPTQQVAMPCCKVIQ
jgi:hypothetical protein